MPETAMDGAKCAAIQSCGSQRRTGNLAENVLEGTWWTVRKHSRNLESDKKLVRLRHNPWTGTRHVARDCVSLERYGWDNVPEGTFGTNHCGCAPVGTLRAS